MHRVSISRQSSDVLFWCRLFSSLSSLSSSSSSSSSSSLYLFHFSILETESSVSAVSCVVDENAEKMTEHTSGKDDRSRRKTGFLSGLVVFPPCCCMIRPFPVLHFPSTPFYRGGNRIQTCKHVAANHQPLTNS